MVWKSPHSHGKSGCIVFVIMPKTAEKKIKESFRPPVQ